MCYTITMAIALDFSFARPSIDSIKAAGVSTVIRYLTGQGKAIDAAELHSYLDAGISVVFVYENTADDAAGGYNAGHANALDAQGALYNLGMDPAFTPPVYFAVDTSVNPQDAVPYFQGLSTAFGPSTLGVYGEGALCETLSSLGLCRWFWQSESTSFPGNSTTLPITHLQQKFDASPVPDTDLNIMCKPDVGQMPRPSPPKPPQTPPYHNNILLLNS